MPTLRESVKNKSCCTCGLGLSVERFNFDRSRPDGLASRCKACRATAYHRDKHKYREDRNAKNAAWRIKSGRKTELKKYGLTPEDYASLLERQGGVCAIHLGPETILTSAGAPRMLSVDHDHDTGRVRGLLCTACNRGIGYLRDDPTILLSASRYLGGV